MPYAIITENDESQWDDTTGELYHFPKKYSSILAPGTKIIYYKGRMKDVGFQSNRLFSAPHYFGFGEIAQVTPDQTSNKNDYFAQIGKYRRFSVPRFSSRLLDEKASSPSGEGVKDR